MNNLKGLISLPKESFLKWRRKKVKNSIEFFSEILYCVYFVVSRLSMFYTLMINTIKFEMV